MLEALDVLSEVVLELFDPVVAFELLEVALELFDPLVALELFDPHSQFLVSSLQT